MNACFAFAMALSTLLGCSQNTTPVQLHPLQANGDASFVCVLRDEAGTLRGAPLDECNRRVLERGERGLIALVTQTLTGEIALINVPVDPTINPGSWFVDVNPNEPGWGFLRVGERPGDIVTTPGGEASFVGVGQLGKPGLFALPTSCLGAANFGEEPRDLTSFAACALPAAPGEIRVAVEPPSESNEIFESCAHTQLANPTPPSADSSRECPVSLLSEEGPAGRRKLLVALPDRGSIAVIDAQSVLDGTPGAFPPCAIEKEVPLALDLPVGPIAQQLPPDLLEFSEGCVTSELPAPPQPSTLRSRPTGLALSERNELFVGDGIAPLIHRLDVSDPCNPLETPPLVTQSFENPSRLVTTSRVAVSPPSPRTGKQFVYAIDEYDFPAGSVMAFDVSPDSTNRTPLVRPGVPYVPGQQADRLQFAGSPKDLKFLMRDRPKVESNVPEIPIGTLCEPDPSVGQDAPGVSYRPNSDFSVGARARELRGIFGAILLSNGQVSVIDVDDFDEPCRRPRSRNTGPELDFRGCRNDPPLRDSSQSPYETRPGSPTVTDEVSCNTVQPHQLRAATVMLTNSAVGVHAPALRTFPVFLPPDTASQTSALQRPKLRGVDFPSVNGVEQPAQVYLGSRLYSRPTPGTTPEFPLDIDPSSETNTHSVVLPFVEPRAYPANEDLALIYEGRLGAEQQSGVLDYREGSLVLSDGSVGYCNIGVHDSALMRDRLRDLPKTREPSEAELAQLSLNYADYVVITSEFPKVEDSYWQAKRASECSYDSCLETFGAASAKELANTREFSIVEAQTQRLSLVPRFQRDNAGLQAAANCCFPEATRYVVRASKQWILNRTSFGAQHRLVPYLDEASGKQLCRPGCDPRRRLFDSRVFEITDRVSACGEPARPDCLELCVADGAQGVALTEPAAACIHDSPISRFAVYRGDSASLRDMRFNWTVTGGFSTLSINLASLNSAVSPAALHSLPDMDWLSVVDSGPIGVGMINLDTLSPVTPTLN